MCCAEWLARALPFAAALVLQACIALPVPHERPVELSTQGTEWAVPGVATRRDFLMRLGDPHFSQRDDTLFVYAADRPTFFWAFGRAGGMASKTYFLFARFDARGVLEELKITDSYRKDPCLETKFCDALPSLSVWQ